MSAKASSSASMPPSTMAEICPRENPSSASGSMPRASSDRPMPTDSAAMAIWALRVSFSSSGDASRTSAATSRPSTSEAQANTFATSGMSNRSAPMPGFWEPWPEAMNTRPAGPKGAKGVSSSMAASLHARPAAVQLGQLAQ